MLNRFKVKSQVDPEKIDITESYRIKARIFLFVAIALLRCLLKQVILNPLHVLTCAGIYLHRLTFVNKERNLDDQSY